MLYSEFLEGTGCRDNTHNYDVYKRVEKLYNNDNDMTHEEAYKIADMWIDNSLTPEEVEKNEETQKQIESTTTDMQYWNDQIKAAKETIKSLKDDITRYREYIDIDAATIEGLKASIIK